MRRSSLTLGEVAVRLPSRLACPSNAMAIAAARDLYSDPRHTAFELGTTLVAATHRAGVTPKVNRIVELERRVCPATAGVVNGRSGKATHALPINRNCPEEQRYRPASCTPRFAECETAGRIHPETRPCQDS